ncbi:MAG TPA: sugar ABC transporter substrate-binding protein [Chloroflexota bacterium]|nr:sugar ABC transporter substrate-binding protein [Chloroflexota bacterium]
MALENRFGAVPGMSRRRFTRGVTALAAGGAGSALMNACGGAGGTSTKEAISSSASPVAIRWTAEVGTPTVDAFNADTIKRIQQKYNGKIDIKVEPHPDPDWAIRYQRYTAMALANSLPEVITLCCQFIRPFMISGLALNLDQFIRKDWKQADKDDFYKTQFEAFQVEGKQLGIPVYANVNIMFVNRNLLKEAGLAYPSEDWTRNQFLDYVIKLNKPGRQWGFDMGFDAADRNCTWIYNNGGEPHDPKDGPVVTKLTYDSPKAIEGLEFLRDLIWKHQVSPRNNDMRGGLSRNDAFLSGKTAIIMDAASSTGTTLFNQAPAAGLDWDFFPLPKGPNGHGGRVSTDGFMIDKTTKFPDHSWAVLQELTNAEGNVARGQLQRQQPARRSVFSAFEKGYEGKTAKIAKLMAETGRADPRAFWKDAVQVEALVKKGFTASIVNNEQPVAAAMKQAMDEVRGYYGAK